MDHASRGTALFQQGKYGKALEAFKRLSRRDRSPAVVSNMAYCLQQLRRHERAVKLFEEAMELQPETQHLFRGACYSYDELGAHEEMLRCALRAVELAPSDSYSWQQLGIARHHLGSYEEAAAAAKKAAELDPSNGYAHYNLAVARLQLGEAGCVELLARAFEHEPALLDYARTDPDIDQLRDDPALSKLLDE